jgi:hypothetical protein
MFCFHPFLHRTWAYRTCSNKLSPSVVCNKDGIWFSGNNWWWWRRGREQDNALHVVGSFKFNAVITMKGRTRVHTPWCLTQESQTVGHDRPSHENVDPLESPIIYKDQHPYPEVEESGHETSFDSIFNILRMHMVLGMKSLVQEGHNSFHKPV